ncbi:polysaccharide deacetylase family protein [Marinovum sp.]|uniref:polysaccharide deacetylase family protein n=1 Tax=Marinovum sp. TaxID=2024839 RepID=UPI003A8EAC08
MSGGELVLSLDFELLWGVRDHATRESYGRHILGGREAIPQMLARFERHGIAATWATVGALFCGSREELLEALPPEELRPRYANAALSNYRYLDEIGRDEALDPCYFAASLVARIAACPGQEIATHTMSHFYGLEAGASLESFVADLDAACKVAARRGITLRSIVFPRNQYAAAHLDALRPRGIRRYRGTPQAWAYRPAAGPGQTLPRRALRLLDAHTGVLGPHLYRPGGDNVPASHFLRPRAGRLAALHPRHLSVIERAMTRAARSGAGFHLWWHPHNFGAETEANLAGLDRLIAHFKRLQGDYGMVSRCMAESGGRE